MRRVVEVAGMSQHCDFVEQFQEGEARPDLLVKLPGDRVIAVGSFKKGSINLEKLRIVSLAVAEIVRPPLCSACSKRMTSDGRGKGYKCKKCSARADAPVITRVPRTLTAGWYEVPPTARRHLARPLCRGEPEF